MDKSAFSSKEMVQISKETSYAAFLLYQIIYLRLLTYRHLAKVLDEDLADLFEVSAQQINKLKKLLQNAGYLFVTKKVIKGHEYYHYYLGKVEVACYLLSQDKKLTFDLNPEEYNEVVSRLKMPRTQIACSGLK